MIARNYRRVKGFSDRCVAWLVSHPRTGWYVAIYVSAMVTLNFVLNVLSLFH